MVQFKRGTAAQCAVYVPLEGQPLWNLDTNVLTIGDGVTPGGHLAIPNSAIRAAVEDVMDNTLMTVTTSQTISAGVVKTWNDMQLFNKGFECSFDPVPDEETPGVVYKTTIGMVSAEGSYGNITQMHAVSASTTETVDVNYALFTNIALTPYGVRGSNITTNEGTDTVDGNFVLLPSGINFNASPDDPLFFSSSSFNGRDLFMVDANYSTRIQAGYVQYSRPSAPAGEAQRAEIRFSDGRLIYNVQDIPVIEAHRENDINKLGFFASPPVSKPSPSTLNGLVSALGDLGLTTQGDYNTLQITGNTNIQYPETTDPENPDTSYSLKIDVQPTSETVWSNLIAVPCISATAKEVTPEWQDYYSSTITGVSIAQEFVSVVDGVTGPTAKTLVQAGQINIYDDSVGSVHILPGRITIHAGSSSGQTVIDPATIWLTHNFTNSTIKLSDGHLQILSKNDVPVIDVFTDTQSTNTNIPKLGFFATTPTPQAGSISDVPTNPADNEANAAAINQILAALRAYGLVAP